MLNAVQAIAFAALPVMQAGAHPKAMPSTNRVWGKQEGVPFHPGYQYGNGVVVHGDPGEVANKVLARILYNDMIRFIPMGYRHNVYIHGMRTDYGNSFLLSWRYDPT